MPIYTIGFTKKSAEEFFECLKKNRIKVLIDIRLNNSSQLAGFTKESDLKYFLKEICDIKYIHDVDLAPTQRILDDYKKNKIDWDKYEELYIQLLEDRKVIEKFKKNYDDINGFCFLCSEPTAEKCHRRLLVEYLKKNLYVSADIIHL